jgi:hypothetical protein
MFLDLNLFCLSNVHHSFLKFEKRFILIIKSEKGLEINKKYICYTHLHIWFKHVFGPLNYKFDDVSLTKVIHFSMVKGMDKFYGGKNINDIVYFIDFYHVVLKNA